MQGYTTKQILNPFFEMPSDYNELVKVYKTLAKSADQRLVRLEQYSKDAEFQSVKKWAYARAMTDIERWSGSQADRFNTAPPKHKLQLIAKINDITTFLESKTSTKAGIQKMFKSRADKINEKYGTDFNWTDMGDFFESDFWEKLDSKYDSDTIMKVLGKMYRNKDKTLENLKNFNKKRPVEHVSDNEVEQKIEDHLMRKGNQKKLREFLNNQYK